MTKNLTPPWNAKYIGYKCIVCEKEITENERQKIIALNCVQTWCMICILKKFPDDKLLEAYAQSDGNNDNIKMRK